MTGKPRLVLVPQRQHQLCFQDGVQDISFHGISSPKGARDLSLPGVWGVSLKIPLSPPLPKGD